jgi:hypothetical protein
MDELLRQLNAELSKIGIGELSADEANLILTIKYMLGHISGGRIETLSDALGALKAYNEGR